MDINRTDINYIVKSPRGVVLLTEIQFQILMEFKGEGTSILNIIEKYNKYGVENIQKLLNKYIFEKLIVKPGANAFQKKTVSYYFRLLTRLELPKAPFLFFIEKVMVPIPTKFIAILSVILIGLSIYSNYSLILYTGFSWSDVPRLFLFLLIGIFIALYHELWMAAFIIRFGGKSTLRFKLRILLGVFISVVVGWEYLLTLKKKTIISTFLLVDLYTAALCGFFSIIGYIFMLNHNESLSFVFCCFSLIGYSYLAINLWPFLLKGDGYHLFCVCNGVSRLRNYFFHMVYEVFTRRKFDFIPEGKMKVYLLWGGMFVLTLLFIEFAFVKGIRLRI